MIDEKHAHAMGTGIVAAAVAICAWWWVMQDQAFDTYGHRGFLVLVLATVVPIAYAIRRSTW